LPPADDEGVCNADDEEPAVGSAVVAGESADDELGADELAPDELDADEPLATAASGPDPPPLPHPATARTAAATTTSPRIAPPFTPDTAMLIAARCKGLGIGHPV
jgi:hypothetical protein